MPIYDDCNLRFTEIERNFLHAKAQWRSLEQRLEEAETALLESKKTSWEKWFCMTQEDLSLWTQGSLRTTVRARLHRFLVFPLEERMRQRVDFTYPEEPGEEGVEEELQARSSNITLAAVSLVYDRRMKAIIDQARKEDTDLVKKIKKTERDEKKQGVVALTGDTKKVSALKRQRPALWEATEAALDAIESPMRKVQAFFQDEVATEMIDRLIATVPAIVCRGLCDWYFERCLVDLEQLEQWWSAVLDKLRGQEAIWDSLHEKEGYLVRRIERGMEEVRTRRGRYTMYATFGGNEIQMMKLMAGSTEATPALEPGSMPAKLEESVNLLATVVSDMLQRIKAIRDSALWRVIDTAQELYMEKRSEELVPHRPPWEALNDDDAVKAMFEKLEDGEKKDEVPNQSQLSPVGAMPMLNLGTQVGPASSAAAEEIPVRGAAEREDASEDEIMDAAVMVMCRLERWGSVAQELIEFFQRPPRREGSEGVCSLITESVAIVAEVNEELLGLLDDPTTEAAREWLKDQYAKRVGGQCAGIGHRLGDACAALPLPPDAELPTKDERKERHRWLVLARGFQLLLADDTLRSRAVAPLGGGVRTAPVSPVVPMLRQVSADIMELSNAPLARDMAVPQDGGYSYRPPNRPSARDERPTPRTPSTSATTSDDAVAEAARLGRSKLMDGQLVAERPITQGAQLPPLSPGSSKLPRGKVSPGGGGGAV